MSFANCSECHKETGDCRCNEEYNDEPWSARDYYQLLKLLKGLGTETVKALLGAAGIRIPSFNLGDYEPNTEDDSNEGPDIRKYIDFDDDRRYDDEIDIPEDEPENFDDEWGRASRKFDEE